MPDCQGWDFGDGVVFSPHEVAPGFKEGSHGAKRCGKPGAKAISVKDTRSIGSSVEDRVFWLCDECQKASAQVAPCDELSATDSLLAEVHET